jgi:capsular polysaccharide biosynthesis protein
LEEKIYRNEDEIDLRELVQTVKSKKKLIYLVTGAITLLGVLYAFVLTKPVYEVKAMIEVGKTNAGTKDESPLDNIEYIKQKLTYVYGINSKKRRDFPRVKSINVPKKSKSIFSIVVEGRDNDSSIQYINTVVQKLESSYALKVKTYTDTQKELISLTKKDIFTSQKNLNDIESTLKDYNVKMLNITEKDAALAGLYTIQISQNQSRLQDLQTRISGLKTKAFNLTLSIAPLRITETHIIGDVEVLEKPIKPKKALIVIVAFITGLMLSIFLVFFLSFLGSLKEEK